MKLLIVTCLKEYLADVARIFKQSNIEIFSANEISSHRNSAPLHLLEDWFATGGEEVDEIIIFTFTSAANAERGMALIKAYNENLKENLSVRAFVMPVEKSV